MKKLILFIIFIFIKTNYRIRITEIKIANDGIFAKGIPYKDRKLTKSESDFNIKGVL